MTDKPAFTPGPWRACEETVNSVTIRTSNDDILSEVFDDAEDAVSKTTLANAHLISAAPDMYAALEAAQVVIGGMDCSHRTLAADLAEGLVGIALRKARGEQ